MKDDMEDITLPLKEILDKGFPEPQVSKLIKPGSYKFIQPNSSIVYSGTPLQTHTRKDSKLSVGFFFDGPFLPIRNGACYTLNNLMRALERSGKVTPSLVNCFRGWDDTSSYKKQPFRSIFIGPSDYYHDTGLIKSMSDNFGIQIAQFYNGEILLNISPWLEEKGVKTILEVQNIEHVLLERLGAPKAEVQKAKKLQSAALKAADHVFCRSEIDKAQAIEMGAVESKVTLYRGGIYAEDFMFEPRLKPRKKIVYMGHMYYQPNEDALRHIITEIMPALGSDYKLTVIGSCPPYMIDKYQTPQIIFKQGVDDISAELLRHDIAVAPIFAGSGTRLKILDYLASGLPIITTTLGIEGLDPEIARFLVIEDDLTEYPAHINEITKKPEYFADLSKLGRAFVRDQYDWSNCVGPFLDVYRKLVKN